jgi:thiosulfate/3-mercaptopyruvate sulfurtransferase
VFHQLVPRAIDVHGDVAIAYYHYAAVTQSEEGAFNTSRGQWTDVFRREGGEWKLLADAGGETESTPDILVSTEWLAQRLGDPTLVVIQVESQPERYSDGHIPGALYLPYDKIVWDGANGEGAEFLPFQEIEATLERLGLEDGNHIVIYGSHPLIATRLWLTLDIMGVGDRISLLDGGLPAWTEEGRPLSVEIPEAPGPGSLTLRPASEIVVDAQWILANLEDPGVALVDARFREEYTGEGQETERIGHLPGAGSAPWVDLVESREVFRFRPIQELATSFQEAGAGSGEVVIPYCIIGLRASLDYFVARLLGYETRFYDGSWRDWSNRGLPLVEGGNPG